MPRPGFDAVPAVSEIDLVEIFLEDLLLGVMPLHLARRRLLAQLARQPRRATDLAAVDDVGVQVADELLRDRAGAAPVLAKDLPFDRAEHAEHVDAVVLIEALVFDGDERLS